MSDTAPTLVLTGGQVLTVDAGFTVAEGVAVRGRDILAVGSDTEMRALAGPARGSSNGRPTLLPGINDSHLHGAAYGMTKPPFAIAVGHPVVGSLADIAAAVGRAVRDPPDGEWIVGLGWGPRYLAECLADPNRFRHRRARTRWHRGYGSAPAPTPDHRARLAAGRGLDGAPRGKGRRPDQRPRTVRAARRRPARLRGHPAWQDFADDFKGTVEPGRAADLCVLDRPRLDLDSHEITEIRVDLTVFDGRVEFER